MPLAPLAIPRHFQCGSSRGNESS